MPLRSLFLRSLLEPRLLAGLSPRDWESMLALGRRHTLSARWHEGLAAAGVLDRIPPRVREHLASDRLLAAERATALRWECNRVRRALQDVGIPLIVLKGGAYCLADLPPARGRLTSDLDILVARDRLDAAESALRANGWVMPGKDDYDDHYYRAWMHELPPMQHALRGTTLDVHHNILPLTSRQCPDPARLLERIEPIGDTGAFMLCAADLLLHSAVHGFHVGELTNGARDALDVHELAAHFAATRPDFWPAFAARARELHLAAPALHALRQARRLFGLSVPPATIRELERAAGKRATRALTDAIIDRAVMPALPPTRLERAALRALHLRSHLVKMPLRLLVPHLHAKAVRRVRTRLAARSAAA